MIVSLEILKRVQNEADAYFAIGGRFVYSGENWEEVCHGLVEQLTGVELGMPWWQIEQELAKLPTVFHYRIFVDPMFRRITFWGFN